MYVDTDNGIHPDFGMGGGTMTAQNQRLVYWPMLKSGDFDLMKSQFDFYLRLLPTAEARTRAYWGHGWRLFRLSKWRTLVFLTLQSYGFKRPASLIKAWNIMHG